MSGVFPYIRCEQRAFKPLLHSQCCAGLLCTSLLFSQNRTICCFANCFNPLFYCFACCPVSVLFWAALPHTTYHARLQRCPCSSSSLGFGFYDHYISLVLRPVSLCRIGGSGWVVDCSSGGGFLCALWLTHVAFYIPGCLYLFLSVPSTLVNYPRLNFFQVSTFTKINLKTILLSLCLVKRNLCAFLLNFWGAVHPGF